MNDRLTSDWLEGVGSALDVFGAGSSPEREPSSGPQAFAADAEALRSQWEAVVGDLSSSMSEEIRRNQKRIEASLGNLRDHFAESFAQAFKSAVFDKLAQRIGEEVAKVAASTIVERLRETGRFDEKRLSVVGAEVRRRVAKDASEAARSAFAKQLAA